MIRSILARAAPLASLSLANAAALVGGLAATMAVLRLLDREEFAAWAVVLSLQALVSVLPQSTGPGCARWLARDGASEDACRRIRSKAAWTGGLLLVLGGSALWLAGSSPVTPLAWILLGLQVPAASAEAHRTLTLQMSRRFHLQAAFLPLTRLLKAAALWGAVATGHEGIAIVALLQLVAQLPSIVPWGRSGSVPLRIQPGPEFVQLRRGNLVSGSVVWGGTRSAVLVLDARATPADTAAYGVADTLCSSMQLPLQALGTVLQPSLYRWTPKYGTAPLLRAGLASLAVGLVLLLVAVLAGPLLLGILAGPTGSDSGESLRILGFGILASSLALVPGILLQRQGAGTTIALLETAAAATTVLGLLLLPSLAAEDAALCWTAGRWVWALGSTFAAVHHGRTLSKA